MAVDNILYRFMWNCITQSLQWPHNERDGVSNYQYHDCLLNRLFRRRSKKTPKLRVTGLSVGGFTGDRWIRRTKGVPAQRASNAENVSILWRHHDEPFRQLWTSMFTFISVSHQIEIMSPQTHKQKSATPHTYSISWNNNFLAHNMALLWL